MTVSVRSPYATPPAPPPAALAPLDAPSDAPPPEAHHHWPLAAAALGGVAVAVGLSGCSSPPPEPPAEPTVSETVPTLTGDHFTQDAVHPAVSLSDAGRIDVIRQTESKDDDDGDSHDEDVDYSPVGLSLGDGLFLDLNGNLSYEVLPQLEAAPSQFTMQGPGWSKITGSTTGNVTDVTVNGAHYRVTQNGNDTTIEEPALFGHAVVATVHREGNETTISRPALIGKGVEATIIHGVNHVEIHQPALGGDVVTSLDRNGSATTFHQPGLFGGLTTQIHDADGQLTLQQPGHASLTVSASDPNHITLEQHSLGTATTTVTRQGNTIQVHTPGLFGGSTTTWNLAP